MEQIRPEFSLSKKIKIIEAFVYMIIWLGIFSMPIFNNRVFETIIWENVFTEWIKLFAFLLIFLLNVTLFVPYFLFKKQYFSYAAGTLISSGIIIGICLWILVSIASKNNADMPPMEIGPGMPPMELSSQMPPPKGFKPNTDQFQKPVETIYLYNFLIALLVVAASTSIALFSKWIKEENKLKELEKEQLKSELAMLRNQASPHFLMNTLNNIHALVDIDSEKAKDAILKLSVLMRYLLYDLRKGKTSLQKEMEFIESYFTLMRLRFSENVVMNLDLPKQMPDIQIPPMIFITFLENSFKHGVSYHSNSFVSFSLAIENAMMNCVIKNSIHKSLIKTNDHYSGIGLVNVRKTLELIYQDTYKLDIIDDGKVFTINLAIPL